MFNKEYYSTRSGKKPKPLDLITLIKAFYHFYTAFEEQGYFYQACRQYLCREYCSYGDEIEIFIVNDKHLDIQNLGMLCFLETKKTNIWPIERNHTYYSEEDLFDAIEFIFELIIKPQSEIRNYCDMCDTFHYPKDTHFCKKSAQDNYRKQLNPLLCLYKDGFFLNEAGQIVALLPDGMDLVVTEVATDDPDNIDARANSAIEKYRNRHSSIEEKLIAVRELAHVLEYIKPQIEKCFINKDEQELFALINNFNIRHHNARQRQDYDLEIYAPWMFANLLSAIHACTAIKTRANA